MQRPVKRDGNIKAKYELGYQTVTDRNEDKAKDPNYQSFDISRA